eukprot:TRINITY_DN71143_c0_g1_i1.p1 TRINITY_DN71143_c0_g1~~TRINITY_DN71143_c0_g1_i1.p1  ORF type:complete len:191 (+),score=30.06 TRINITY_DN71143_c0_g1_i1:78-650(+)
MMHLFSTLLVAASMCGQAARTGTTGPCDDDDMTCDAPVHTLLETTACDDWFSRQFAVLCLSRPGKASGEQEKVFSKVKNLAQSDPSGKVQEIAIKSLPKLTGGMHELQADTLDMLSKALKPEKADYVTKAIQQAALATISEHGSTLGMDSAAKDGFQKVIQGMLESADATDIFFKGDCRKALETLRTLKD